MATTSVLSPLRGALGRVAAALLLVGCVIGVFALIDGQLSKNEAKVIATTFAASFFLACSQACASLDAERSSFVSTLGFVSALAGIVVTMWGVWFQGYQEPSFWRALGSLGVLSLACAHHAIVTLLAHGAVLQALRVVASLSTWALAGALIGLLLEAFAPEPELWRALGTAALISASTTAALVVLHRILPTPVHVDDELAAAFRHEDGP